MNLEEKAGELGRMIGQSTEYQTVRKASEALNNERELVEILQRMEGLRVQAQQMIERGEQPTAEMEQELDGMLERVQQSVLYQNVAVAQENFDKLMMRVNEWILAGIRKGAQSSIITLA